MDPIKEAFSKIKEDIFFLKQELFNIKQELLLLKEIQQANNQINNPTHTQTNQQTDNPTHNNALNSQTNTQTDIPTHQHINPTQQPILSNNPTHSKATPTHRQHLQGLYEPNYANSIGSRGVPTNKQTNQQTDNPTHNNALNSQTNTQTDIPTPSNIEQIDYIIESLDDIKKEIRRKFKNLTEQEMLVFSTLYTMQDKEGSEVNYKQIAAYLGLSESSIRDYINRLIKKGIPIEKIKKNNKIIVLSISENLKKIANLSTIMSLRSI